MKRIISFSLFIGILFLAFQFVTIYFNQGHELTYNFQSGENEYEIKEKLVIENNIPIYHFEVKSNDHLFLLENKTDYNKQKKIISDIKNFVVDGIECIYPVYQDRLEDVHDPVCVQNGRQYSYTYLRTQNENLETVKTKLLEDGIILPAWEESSATKDYSNVFIHQEDLPDNLYLAIWKYQGIEIFTNEMETYTSLLVNDDYQNRGMLVDQYFVVPEFNLTSEFKAILVADITTSGNRRIELDEPISNDCYFNGTVDGRVYLFDRTNLKQYEITPKDNQIRMIGNTDLNAQYYDGSKWQDRNIYDFTKEEIHFVEKPATDEGVASYQPKEVVETDNSYYFIDAKENLFRVYKDHLDYPILLCSVSGMKELNVANDYLAFLANDTIYFYHESYGLRPLITYNEFLYNNDNVFVTYYQY